MDYQKILQIVKNKVNSDYIIKDIQDCISRGSTGGEISFMVGKYLKDLEFKDNKVYSVLKEDISKYLIECENQGLIVE